ncbi:hypothetical protein [Synechococcus sp. MIT S9451]|uniref:hypothetical protein n=1 Tax=Synechococcus sp. MIT S9451 TaxID=3082543 RepID=UPI0039B66B6D
MTLKWESAQPKAGQVQQTVIEPVHLRRHQRIRRRDRCLRDLIIRLGLAIT